MPSAKTGYNTEKVTGDVLSQGRVVTEDISAAGVLVGEGKMIRIRVTAQTYIQFGKVSTMGAVTSGSSPALELNTAGTYLVCAEFDYIRASANAARLEVL